MEPEWASISAFELIKNQFDLLESVVDEAISKFGPIPYRSTVSLDELE
ncbi:MAG: hypothetical protein K8R85_09415 [Bacteroidetes bacterium]|nr:hypothetical protein [Bacteroidota bacterium]